jgi:pyruvate formate lyase activating enzyme
LKERGIWVEVTTLLIPSVNDSDEELGDIARFLVSLGTETPWHISRFHPDYRFTETRPTTSESIARAREIGRAAGLHYVYAGNLPGDPAESTYCHSCGELLIERLGFQLGRVRLKDGACPGCGTKMAGVEIDYPPR